MTAIMKIKIFRLFAVPFFVLTLNSLPCFAGGGLDGGGGRSKVCRDGENKIVSAELLDLFEGSLQFQLKIPTSNESVEVQIRKAELKLRQGTRLELKYLTQSVFTHFIYLPSDTKLAPIDDSHEFILPKNCNIEQVANFSNPNQIYIDSEIWEKFDNTSKAALVMHETLYWLARMGGATDSRRSRHLNAFLFAEKTSLEDVYEGLSANSLACFSLPKNINNQDQKSWIFFANQTQNGWQVQFTKIAGQPVFSKKTIYVSNPFDLKKELTSRQGVVADSDIKSESTMATSKFESGDIITIALRDRGVVEHDATATVMEIEGVSETNSSEKFEASQFICRPGIMTIPPMPTDN